MLKFFILSLHLTMIKASYIWNVTCANNCTCTYAISTYLMQKMKTVDCSNCDLYDTPQISIDTQVLLLRKNRLEIFFLYNPARSVVLQELDLSDNKLTLQYPSFSNLPRLVWLNLTRNSIKVLDHGIFSGLRHLEVLDLTYNAINTIKSHAFAGLNYLYKIHLSHNLLKQINHEWFPTITYLRELYLDYNNITQINGGDFGILKYLDTLSISGNKISLFEENTFKGVTTIRILNMSYNKFTKVPSDELHTLTALRHLIIDGNPITRIHENDFYDSQLTDVEMSNMPKLRLIENRSFNRMDHLTVLKISNNPKLFFIDRLAFYKLSYLQTIYLNDNRLLGVSQEVVVQVPELSEIHIYNNPLTCDCNVHWVKQLLVMAASYENMSNIIKFPKSEQITCYSPFNWTKLNLNNIPMSNLSPICSPTGIPLFADNIQLEIGDDLSLECHSMGLPPPRTTWILPNGVVLNESTTRINITNRSLLFLPDIRDSEAGTYACMVANSFGYDYSSTMVRVHTTTIKVEPIGVSKNFIRITWSGSGMTVYSSKYKILCTEVSTHRIIRELTLHQSVRDFTIGRLKPDTTYEFCVGYEHNHKWNLLNCRKVTTLHGEYDGGGIKRVSKTNVVIGTMCGILLIVLVIIVVAVVKEHKKKGYNSDDSRDSMVEIPLTNIVPPTPLCTSRTSLLAGSQI